MRLFSLLLHVSLVIFLASPAHAESDINSKENAKSLANVEEREMVYEKCVSDHRISSHFDCECLAEKAATMYPQINTEMTLKMRMQEYSLAASREGSCRNITAAARREYATCMTGTGFDYRGVPQEDYCECYAETWGKLYEEHEGKEDSNIKSRISMKARIHCYKSLADKAK